MKKDILNKLGFSQPNGLVFCQNFDEAENNAEHLYLIECQKLPTKPDAVFFRRFYENDQAEISQRN